MANQALHGRYKAKVKGVSIGEIGANGSVAIEISFKPSAELVAADWVEGEYRNVRKPYWLGDKVGKNGKTSLELSRSQLKDTFGYTGGLNQAEIEAAIMDKDVELTCKPNEKGYTEIEYVNPPGGGNKGLKRLKAAPEDKMAKLAALWSGKPVEEKHIDPTQLFASLAASTESAA